MRVRPMARFPSRPVDDLPGVTVRRLGRASDVDLKAFTFRRGASTPPHRHAHTHLVVVLAGAGAVESDGSIEPIRAGTVITTSPDEPHGFTADHDADLHFVCLDTPRE
jgi:quercetin dioxygenase-like cupin family protein